MAVDPKHRVPPDSVETGGPIAVVCPCGKTASVSAELAGKKVRCGNCRRIHIVDAHSTSAPAAAESLVAGHPQAVTLGGAGKSTRTYQEILSPPQKSDEIGRLGPYRVLQVLGAGGMGVVFKAEDPALGCFVALKAMLPSVADVPAAKERFLREARAAAALKGHDHVVDIHRVDEDRGIPYFAMQFLEGESLESCLKREGRLPLAEVLRIGREIADGLAAAHERGLIHRDIKPGNVWLERRSIRRNDGSSDASVKSAARIKILDFGLARSVDDATITQSGAIIGTALYMPLEQAKGERVNARGDLYSLGVVLYQMATGKMPIKGINLIAVLTALMTQTPIEPSKHDPKIPARLNDLIMRLLSRNPEDRPASASQVYAALKRIEETPEKAAPVPAPEPVAPAPAPTPAAGTPSLRRPLPVRRGPKKGEEAPAGAPKVESAPNKTKKTPRPSDTAKPAREPVSPVARFAYKVGVTAGALRRALKRRRLTYSVVVVAIALIALGAALVPRLLEWTHTSLNSDPQIAALFAKSWTPIANDGVSTGESGFLISDPFQVSNDRAWTFSKDRLSIFVLESDGRAMNKFMDGSSFWQTRLRPGFLELIREYSEREQRFRFLIRTATADSLVLELEEFGQPTGRLLTFSGRPRVVRDPSSNGPPFWAFVLIQAAAALLAHRAARSFGSAAARFGIYLFVNLVVAVVLSPVAYLFPETGFLAGLGQAVFMFCTVVLGLLLGLVGGTIHIWLPVPASATMEK
jgi:serine/threonine protein kinase